MAKVTKEEKKSEKSDNTTLCAALSYLLIGLIWYAIDDKMKKSEFVKFHVKQGLILLVIAVIYSIILQIITFPLHFLGFLGEIIIWVLQLTNLIFVVLAIIGVINALNKNKKLLPIIGGYAEDLFTF